MPRTGSVPEYRRARPVLLGVITLAVIAVLLSLPPVGSSPRGELEPRTPPSALSSASRNAPPVPSTERPEPAATDLEVSIEASRPAVDLGQSVTFTANVSGETQAVSYTWTSQLPGCPASDGRTVTCTPSEAGDYGLEVEVSEPSGDQSEASIAYDANIDPVLEGAISASEPSADVGQTVMFGVPPLVGGTPPFTYNWSGLPPGCNDATAVCHFTSSGLFAVSVTATDSVGITTTPVTRAYLVSPTLTLSDAVAFPSQATTNTAITFDAIAGGGSGGYSYTWSGLPNGCVAANSRWITCTPSAVGQYGVSVTVTDSNGAWVTSPTLRVTVTAASYVPPTYPPYPLAEWILLVATYVILLTLAVRLFERRKSPPWGPFDRPSRPS